MSNLLERAGAMLTLLYFFLTEPDVSSPPGWEMEELSVLPSKASGRMWVSITQASLQTAAQIQTHHRETPT